MILDSDLAKLEEFFYYFVENNGDTQILSHALRKISALNTKSSIAQTKCIAKVATDLFSGEKNDYLLQLLLQGEAKSKRKSRYEVSYRSLLRSIANSSNDIAMLLKLLTIKNASDTEQTINQDRENLFIRIFHEISAGAKIDFTSLEEIEPGVHRMYNEFIDNYINNDRDRSRPNQLLLSGARSRITEFKSSANFFANLSANNAYKRNIYSEYINVINSLQQDDFEKIFKNYPGDHEEQIKQIKILARKKCTTKIFNNTIYVGVTGSILFCGILATFAGPWVALFPFAFGLLGTTLLARYNKRALKTTINDIIENDHNVDLLVIEAMSKIRPNINVSSMHLMQTNNLHFQSAANIAISSASIFSGGGLTTVLAPLVELWRHFIHMYDAHTVISDWGANPVNALRDSNNVKIDNISLMSLKSTEFLNNMGLGALTRNKFKSYLLENLPKVKNLLSDQITEQSRQEAVYSDFGRLESIMRLILEPVGIWESKDFNLVLNALYAPNSKAHAILQELRKDCEMKELNKELTDYLKNNYATIFNAPKSDVNRLNVEDLNDADYKKLYRSFLNYKARQNVENSVFAVGDALNFTVSAVVLGAVYMTPIFFAAPFIALSVFMIGKGITRFASKIKTNMLMKKIMKVPDEEIDELMYSKADLGFVATHQGEAQSLLLNNKTPVSFSTDAPTVKKTINNDNVRPKGYINTNDKADFKIHLNQYVSNNSQDFKSRDEGPVTVISEISKETDRKNRDVCRSYVDGTFVAVDTAAAYATVSIVCGVVQSLLKEAPSSLKAVELSGFNTEKLALEFCASMYAALLKGKSEAFISSLPPFLLSDDGTKEQIHKVLVQKKLEQRYADGKDITDAMLKIINDINLGQTPRKIR